MNDFIARFGRFVGETSKSNPQGALRWLRRAYWASGLQNKYFPDKRLLPHQKYVAIADNRAIRAPLSDPRNSAIVNLFLPCELLLAMDIAPQFTEGLACYLTGAGCGRTFIDRAETEGVPKTYCSYHKILLGAGFSGVLPKPRFVANTTLACDANTNTFRSLAEHWGVPQITIDVPNALNQETIGYVAEQFRAMAGEMEGIVGKRLEPEKLKAVLRRENRSMSLYREYFRELSGKYIPSDLTSEMCELFFTHVLLGTKEAEEYFELLLRDAQTARASNGEIRVLWAHSIPYWQDSMKGFFNFNPKVQLLCSDLNFDSISEMDADRPYESMARRLLENTMSGPVDRRADKIAEAAAKLRADGVVYFCHWGCKQTLGGAHVVKDALEKAGKPVLILDGDGCDPENINDGQMSTRLQAFLEILEASK